MAQKTQKSGGEKPSKASVSAHPLFGAVVALWFAALLGLGSAVLPDRLVESLVGATGLPAILPAAAPPLGLTARILIAVAASGLGVVIGLLIARRIGAAQASPKSSSIDFASVFGKRKGTARPPLSIHDELGENPSQATEPAAPGPLAGRRRALAIAEDNHADEAFGDTPYPDANTALPAEAPAEVSLDEPLILDNSHDAMEWEPVAPQEPLEARDIFDTPFEEPEAAEEPLSLTAEYEPVTAPEIDSLAERAAEPIAAPFAPPMRNQDIAPVSPHPITQRPLNQLGMAELVERLAHAIQDRQARGRTPDMSRGNSYGEQQMPVPTALRPIAFDSEGFDDDPETAAFSLPTRAFGSACATRTPYRETPLAAAALTGEWDESEQGEEEEGDPEEAGYSSLLNLQTPFFPPETEDERDPDTSIDDTAEASRFPAPSPTSASTRSSPVNTEQALRDALANLQRISGAA